MSKIFKSNQVKTGKKTKISKNKSAKKDTKKSGDKANQKKETASKIKRNKMLDEAKEKSELIIQAAKNKAEKIKNNALKEAKEKIEKEKEAAKKEGFEKGYQEGQAAGKKEAYQAKNKEIAALINQLEQKVSSFNSKLEARIPKLEEEVLLLVRKISEKVITKELSLNQAVIKDIIQQAINSVNQGEDIKVKINPDYINDFNECKKELLENNTSAQEIKIISDSSIDSAGCIIETDFGGIDATVASQLDEIETKVLRGKNNES